MAQLTPETAEQLGTEPSTGGPAPTAPTTPPATPTTEQPVVDTRTWVSCEDGQTRQGLPPDGWIQTAQGCYKPPAPTTLPGTTDLRQVVDIIPSILDRIERAYVIGSGVMLEPYRITFFNKATNMSVVVKLTGPTPVKFVLAGKDIASDSFELQPQQGRQVDVQFIQEELNKLPAGLIQSDILVVFAAGTVTIAKDQDDTIDIGPPPVVGVPLPPPITLPVGPPPEEAPTPTWKDGTSGTVVVREGFPPANYVLRADGVYIAPTPTPPTTKPKKPLVF